MVYPEYIPYKKKRKSGLTILFLICFLILLGFGLYQIPWVNRVVSWRLDLAITYVHRILNPVEELPAPMVSRSTESGIPSSTPLPSTSTPTPVISPTPTAIPTPIPSTTILNAPEYDEAKDKQDWNNCGPATLTLYLRYYGWEGDQFDISSIIKPTRDDRNVNVEELVYYVRNYSGWLKAEFRVGGDVERIKKLLAAGFPVMIEESFTTDRKYWPEDDLWSGHYLLITGYNDTTRTFTVQDSEIGPNQSVNYDILDKKWQGFNRVYIIVYRSEQEQTLKEILGDDWDLDKNREKALTVAQQEAEEDPQNAFAWFNVGTNQTYFKNYSQAAAAYDTARSIGLPQRMLRYQFGPFIAYFQIGRTEDVLTLTKYALDISRTSEEAMLWRGWAFYQNGDKSTALNYFRDALKIREDYEDALWAIDYVNAN
ncbi:MAG: C39 family peptidase [Anaerolineaceae bacterium]